MTETFERLPLADVATRAGRILDEVERVVVGKRAALELALCALLADGHVLIEDYPGLAKTLIARSFATATGTRFSRVQFTPDLMPSDVTGASIFNQRTAEFEFRPGPVFTNVLLADEINRAPPKTQAALLEAMQERQVTIDGAHPAARAAVPGARDPEPDRVRGHLSAPRGPARPLPDPDAGRLPVRRRRVARSSSDRLERRGDEAELEAVVDRGELIAMQRAVEYVHVSERNRALHRAARRRHARQSERPGRREPARNARADEARPCQGGSRRTRLRRAR